jgi:hypothetical protein
MITLLTLSWFLGGPLMLILTAKLTVMFDKEASGETVSLLQVIGCSLLGWMAITVMLVYLTAGIFPKMFAKFCDFIENIDIVTFKKKK